METAPFVCQGAYLPTKRPGGVAFYERGTLFRERRVTNQLSSKKLLCWLAFNHVRIRAALCE